MSGLNSGIGRGTFGGHDAAAAPTQQPAYLRDLIDIATRAFADVRDAAYVQMVSDCGGVVVLFFNDAQGGVLWREFDVFDDSATRPGQTALYDVMGATAGRRLVVPLPSDYMHLRALGYPRAPPGDPIEIVKRMRAAAAKRSVRDAERNARNGKIMEDAEHARVADAEREGSNVAHGSWPMYRAEQKRKAATAAREMYDQYQDAEREQSAKANAVLGAGEDSADWQRYRGEQGQLKRAALASQAEHRRDAHDVRQRAAGTEDAARWNNYVASKRAEQKNVAHRTMRSMPA